MKTCYIVGAGDFTSRGLAPAEGDLLIAADGGYDWLRQSGLTPDFLLGDLDSLGVLPSLPAKTKLLRYPVEKDDTDTALALGEEWFKELNDIYYGREKQAYELLDALGCRYRKGQAGLFVWAELPEGYEGDSFAFSDEVMEKTDVFLTPGGIFGSEGNGYIRITLCCPEALLKKATEKIKAAFGK